jgi:3-hydroxyacyl-CoA dehydrogenase
MITHFFNPPRYMRLLELVTGPETRGDAIEEITDFCDRRLGKGVVRCNDTPGFIANRIGAFWLDYAITAALEAGISIEEADAVLSRPVGVPKTGVFGLVDLVGIDLMPHLARSLLDNLPGDDRYAQLHKDHKFVDEMIAAGYTGRKGKGGFYRLDTSGGKREKQVIDLSSGQFSEDHYAPAQRPRPAATQAGKTGLRAVLDSKDAAGAYALDVMSETLCYAAALVPEIADNVHDVDEAMRLGYNWKYGPFEMIDKIGPAWLAGKIKEKGLPVPPLLEQLGERTFYRANEGRLEYFGTDGQYHELARPDGVLLLSDIKLAGAPVLKNGSASVWDIGDGVLCFEKHSKMNTFDDKIFELLNKTTALIGDGSGDYKALVIYNDGSAFSAGANLGLALFMINIAMWPQVEQFVALGQKTFQTLKSAPFPVVAAPSGLALGGGCEILLHSDAVQAHAETYTGLVEVGVGVIPGWGGCKEMILRFQEREAATHNDIWFSPPQTPMGAARKAFETIGMATVAKSAFEAQDIGYFRESDGVTMNRARLLFDAKQKALKLAENYTPADKREDIRLPGPSGKMALDLAVGDLRKSGKATPYDVVVSDYLAGVLTGGENADWTAPRSEDDILTLEREAFMGLLREQGTMDRIEHMLDKGKPLRN